MKSCQETIFSGGTSSPTLSPTVSAETVAEMNFVLYFVLGGVGGLLFMVAFLYTLVWCHRRAIAIAIRRSSEHAQVISDDEYDEASECNTGTDAEAVAPLKE